MSNIPHSSKFSDWVWPVGRVDGNPPIISDGYGATKRNGKGHFGIDVMHHRRGTQDAKQRGSKNFCIYDDEPAIAVADGLVQETGHSATGYFVRLYHRVGDEGRPIVSVYRHLTGFAEGVEKDAIVSIGSPLGKIGDDPRNPNDPPHLHFELWDISRNRKYPAATFDPILVMREWRMRLMPEFEFDNHPYPPKGSGNGLALLPGL